MSFAGDLKRERTRLGLTQAEAAEALDIGLKTYAVWERGDDPRRNPLIVAQEGALARLRKIKPRRNAEH